MRHIDLARQELAKQGKDAAEPCEPPTGTCRHHWKEDDRGFRWAVFRCVHCAEQCYTQGQHPDQAKAR